jgi:hypothetical protein
MAMLMMLMRLLCGYKFVFVNVKMYVVLVNDKMYVVLVNVKMCVCSRKRQDET